MAATLTISPSTVTPGATFTASGTAERKGGASTSCRILVENVVKSTFSVGPSGKYSRQVGAPTGADRTAQVLLQQLQGTGQWATTAPARTLTIQASQPAPQPTIPTVPLSFSGVAGNTTAALSWSAPSSNGGSALTGYIVYKNGAELTTTVAGTTTYTAGGLVNNTDYQFSAAAKNAVGTGPQTSPPITVRPVAPGDTTAPVVSNVAHSSVTQTSAVISWSLNEPATGRVRYGLSPTALTVLTAPETSFDYSAHIQTISPLTANTPYYYQVFGADAAGNPYTSATQSFTTAAVSVPPPPPPPGAVYPPTQTFPAYMATNSDPRPGYLAEITDSTFGTKIRRITNTHLWRNDYPRHSTWNKDSSKIFLGYGRHILNGTTYADLRQLPSGADYPVWSELNADYMYGVNTNQNVVKRYSFASNTWITIRTIAGKGHLSLGNGEGNLSDNDRVALIYNTVAGGGGTWGVLCYDIPNDTIVSDLAIGTGGASAPNYCQMSRSGQYVIIGHGANGTGTNQGTRVYQASNMAHIRQISVGRPHSDSGRDINGNDIYVHVANLGDGVSSHRLDNGTETLLVGGADIYGVCHVSCTNYERPGWVYLSVNANYPNNAGNDLLVAAQTDGSLQVQVFGFAHNALPGAVPYDANTHMAANRRGDRVIWGGAWGYDPYSQVYSFVAGMTT